MVLTNTKASLAGERDTHTEKREMAVAMSRHVLHGPVIRVSGAWRVQPADIISAI